jgi:hypothetical protein
LKISSGKVIKNSLKVFGENKYNEKVLVLPGNHIQ